MFGDYRLSIVEKRSRIEELVSYTFLGDNFGAIWMTIPMSKLDIHINSH